MTSCAGRIDEEYRTCKNEKKGTAWKSGVHQGIDLVGITSKKVYAICIGIVERAGYDKGGFGKYVRIKENVEQGTAAGGSSVEEKL